MTRLYIATCLERRNDALALAFQLRAQGYAIASTWHDSALDRSSEATLNRPDARSIRRENVLAISRSDVFVCLADPRCRGTLVEIEHALHRTSIIPRAMVCIGDPRVLGPMSAISWDVEIDDADRVSELCDEITRRCPR